MKARPGLWVWSAPYIMLNNVKLNVVSLNVVGEEDYLLIIVIYSLPCLLDAPYEIWLRLALNMFRFRWKT